VISVWCIVNSLEPFPSGVVVKSIRILSLVEYIYPYASNEVFTLSINKRMNTVNLTIPELALVLQEQNLTWGQVFAMPEQDSWVYPDGVSLVCSSFVIALYRAGGLFGNLTIQATEFTPRDLYQTILINPTPTIPADCQAMDPANPYCQLMGKYRMEFPGISTVPLYQHMNEQCPSFPPMYERTEGC